jgi:putative NIF3 family GTP cyclohydrolase 1 type 2
MQASPVTGGGRVATLSREATVDELLPLIKSHLSLSHVRLARSTSGNPVQTVGVCCGSGASLLPLSRQKIDLYLTGEMSHHEVLDAVHNGTHVVLCDHSNTERGSLVDMKNQLELLAKGCDVQFLISESDADPLVIV